MNRASFESYDEMAPGWEEEEGIQESDSTASFITSPVKDGPKQVKGIQRSGHPLGEIIILSFLFFTTSSRNTSTMHDQPTVITENYQHAPNRPATQSNET